MPDAFDKLLPYLYATWGVTIFAIFIKYAYLAYRYGLAAKLLFAGFFDMIVIMAWLFLIFLAVGAIWKLFGSKD